MPRPPLPVGTWGKVKRTEVGPGRWVARARFRDYDGRTRLVEAWGKSGAAAERSLKAALTERATPTSGQITADTRLSLLAERWLEEARRSNLATNSISRYEALVKLHIGPGVGGLRIRRPPLVRSTGSSARSPTRPGRQPRGAAGRCCRRCSRWRAGTTR